MPRLYAIDPATHHQVPGDATKPLELQGKGTGQRVALLVNGPSLTSLWTSEDAQYYEVIVAMNSAAWLFTHDFAVATDRVFIDNVVAGTHIRPSKAMVCYPVYRPRLAAVNVPWMEIPSVQKAKPYTFPRAILFALSQAGPLGSVEIFGVDWNDSNDVAGLNGSHHAKRWEEEAQVVRRVWDKRIRSVHGCISLPRLAYFHGETDTWR